MPLLSFTPSSSLDAQCAEENNKGFFLRKDNLSPRCLPDYTTVILSSVVILHRPMIVALFLRQSTRFYVPSLLFLIYFYNIGFNTYDVINFILFEFVALLIKIE